MDAVAGSQREVRGSAEQATFIGRERAPELVGVDELVALFRTEAAHAADRSVHGLATVRRQLPELLEELPRLLLLVLRQVFPGFHPVKHALLLLRRQAGKTLQSPLQFGLSLRWKPAKLRIIFQRAALLCRGEIFVAS